MSRTRCYGDDSDEELHHITADPLQSLCKPIAESLQSHCKKAPLSKKQAPPTKKPKGNAINDKKKIHN